MKIDDITNNKAISNLCFYGAGIVSGYLIGQGVNYFDSLINDNKPIMLTNLVINTTMCAVGIKIIQTAISSKVQEIIEEKNKMDEESDIYEKCNQL